MNIEGVCISLNLFSDTLPISASFGYSSTYLPCSFVWSIFLCWLISLNFGVCGLLSMGCSIIIPLSSDVCSLLGEIDPGVCVGFLVPALSLVELDLVPLIGRKCQMVFLRWLWTLYDFRQPVFWWVGLCSCLGGFLVWSFLALEPVGVGMAWSWCWNVDL